MLEKIPKEILKTAFLFAEPAVLETVSYQQEAADYTLMLWSGLV